MESMDVTPFGSGQLAAQWKDNGGRGQMNWRRAPARRCGGNNLKGKK
jgi:hypothetical protein